MKNFLIISSLVAASSAFSQVQFNRGNDLKQVCEQKDNLFSAGFCLGYVIGVSDSLDYQVCAPGGPGGVTQGQFRDIVVKYLSDNPSQLHLHADILVLTALRQAFPCQKK
jgi:hypothetical protein